MACQMSAGWIKCHCYISPGKSTKTKYIFLKTIIVFIETGRSQRPRGLIRGSAAAGLLGLRVRIPPGHGCLSLVSIVYCEVEVSALT